MSIHRKHSRPEKAANTGRWSWFKLYGTDWETTAVKTLDLDTLGFLFDLHCRMIRQASPVSYDVILLINRSRRINRVTVDKMLEKLTDSGLIYLTDAGYWRDEAETVVEEMNVVSEKISKRNANVSKKRWQKTEQNQGNLIPEEERELEEAAPTGQASTSNIVEDNYSERAGEEAGRRAPITAPKGAMGASTASDEESDFNSCFHDEIENSYDGPMSEDEVIYVPEWIAATSEASRPASNAAPSNTNVGHNRQVFVFESADDEERLSTANADATIECRGFGSDALETYLTDLTTGNAADRMMRVLSDGMLTVGAVRAAIKQARETRNAV